MDRKIFDITTDIAWCPGCGNLGLRNIMLEVMAELELTKDKLCFVS